MKVVSIFGGSNVEKKSQQWLEAFQIGNLLAKAGYAVMNGGYGGTMAASAQGAKSAGGKTIGITTRDFGPSKANGWIDREKRLPHWEDRLFYLIKNSQASVALPGNLGTLIEVAVTLEMMRKKRIHPKFVILFGSEWKKTFHPFLIQENGLFKKYVRFANKPKDVIKLLS